VCENPSNAGSCSCSVSGSSFNCAFQPTVSGNYTLVFKSGLSENNQTVFTLNPGYAPVIAAVFGSSGSVLDGVLGWLASLFGGVWSFLKRLF
jgi:hypothetical protein